MKRKMNMIEKVSVAVVWAFAATALFADIKLLEPAQDATVSQHTPMQARLVGETIAEREKYFDGGVNAKELKDAGSKPKEILLKWQGGKAPYKVELRRIPDGKVFFSQIVDKTEAIVDSLEIAREWEWSVASAGETVRGRFKTQDSAPRLIKINGAVNARDLGGWIGLDGRRIRQGLIFRTAGLNRNAPIEYYSLAEIKKLHAEGKLAGMGPEGKKHSWQLDSGVKLTEKDMRLIKRSCYAPGEKTLSEDECSRLRLLYGFRTDIDLRRPDEVYGMTGSPLGADVNWVNIPLMRGYGGFVKEEFFEEKRKIFRVIFDRKAYPIVFHCIGGADRTGTIAFMIEALLGADDNTLTLDYLITGLAAGVTDAKHKLWFDSMMKALRSLPGATNAEKMNGFFLRLGFTQKEIDDFREFMLEAQPVMKAADSAAFSVFAPGRHGVLDGTFTFASATNKVQCHGFDVCIDGRTVWRGGTNSWKLVKVETQKEGDSWTVTHFVEICGKPVPVAAKITFDGEIMRIAWSMPGVVRDNRGSPRFTYLAPGWFDSDVKRVYWGFGNVMETPELLRTSGNGSSSPARHVGADFASGVSLVQATDVFPLYFECNRQKRRFRLETAHDATFTFVPSGKGAFAAAKRFSEVCGYRKAPGVDRAKGKMCLDRWGGTDYRQDVSDLKALMRYGLKDSFYIKHVWQCHGYDRQLPDVWPPRGDRRRFDALVRCAKENGLPFGFHDNYIDFYTNATGFAWNMMAYDENGNVQKAFYNPLSKEQSYRIQPHLFEPFLRRNMRLMREETGSSASFLDVFASVRPFDYYDAEGNFFSAVQTACRWRKAFDVIREELGRKDAITVSEAGHDWLIGHLDAVACDHYPASRLVRKCYATNAFARVPWMDIVTHGRMILLGGGLGPRYCAPAWRVQGDNLLHGYGSDDYFCTTVIGGRNPMCEGVFMRPTVATYWQLHDVCASLSKGDFRSFSFVGDNIYRQCSEFSTGKVWANVSTNSDWEVEGRILPPYGFYVRSDDGEAGVVLQEGQRIAFASSRSLRFVDARPSFIHRGDEKYNPKGRESEMGLNLGKRLMDFGGIKTDGAFRVDFSDPSSWEIAVLPGSKPFKAYIDAKQVMRNVRKIRNVIAVGAPADAAKPVWKLQGTTVFLELDGKAEKYRVVFPRVEEELFSGMPWQLGEQGLFRLDFADGGQLYSGSCDVQRKEEAGSIVYSYGAPRADVEVVCSKTKSGWDIAANVKVKGTSPLLNVAIPARLRFDGSSIDSFTVPQRDCMGPGMAFNSGFFDYSRSKTDKAFFRTGLYKVEYPTAFSDFVHALCKNGKSVAMYSLQPRAPHEPWRMPKEKRFVPGAFACGVDYAGGWMDRRFVTYVKPGEAWTAPKVRIAAGCSLAQALDDYAAENTLDKTLADKLPDVAKRERFKNAPFITFSYESTCAEIRQALDYLPVPSHIRIYGYMKGGFDRQYPDFLPPRKRFGTADEFKALLADIRSRGHIVSPYINPTLWCDNPRGETFVAAGDAPLSISLDGKHYPEQYGTAKGWAVTLWHPAVRAANEKLRRQFTQEYPVDMIFEDQHGARKFIYDMNPAAPSPRDYTEGIISLCEEGSAIAPLGTENGWDRVANEMTMLEGISYFVFPSTRRPKWVTSMKREYPPELWRMEALAQRLFHGKVIFKHHDNGQFVDNDKTIAWTLALGYIMNWGVPAKEYAQNPEKRAWFEKLAGIQRQVVAPLLERRLVAFKHDRSVIFREGNNPQNEDDDGFVVADYEGGYRLLVNLGAEMRTVDGEELGPYGYRLKKCTKAKEN